MYMQLSSLEIQEVGIHFIENNNNRSDSRSITSITF